MPGLNSNPSNSNSSARNGITGDETPPRIAYYLNPNTGEVEMVIIPEGAPLPHDPRAASWGFIDWNEAFRAAYHSRDDCPRRGTAGTNGTSGGSVEASVAATPTGNNTSAESSQVQNQGNSVDDNVSEGTSQTQQD
ncbi:hypothetical protein K435DRAFT_874753 [Dendrothele bispora CBS 962.96]|uniref:Uncharacterized protein n=1 Tax=Dendrothele bispora (strain CBS 962.96) TaxID=1314807 RepID=A0A4S8KVZ3_DENBC|nr:hypothetical protein K435DRAFT_874753 [Dendrothele bispora CBS 962.96]